MNKDKCPRCGAALKGRSYDPDGNPTGEFFLCGTERYGLHVFWTVTCLGAANARLRKENATQVKALRDIQSVFEKLQAAAEYSLLDASAGVTMGWIKATLDTIRGALKEKTQ